jgi:hypothetical protein
MCQFGDCINMRARDDQLAIARFKYTYPEWALAVIFHQNVEGHCKVVQTHRRPDHSLYDSLCAAAAVARREKTELKKWLVAILRPTLYLSAAATPVSRKGNAKVLLL